MHTICLACTSTAIQVTGCTGAMMREACWSSYLSNSHLRLHILLSCNSRSVHNESLRLCKWPFPHRILIKQSSMMRAHYSQVWQNKGFVKQSIMVQSAIHSLALTPPTVYAGLMFALTWGCALHLVEQLQYRHLNPKTLLLKAEC